MKALYTISCVLLCCFAITSASAQRRPLPAAEQKDSLRIVVLLNEGRLPIANVEKKGRDFFMQAFRLLEKKHGPAFLDLQVETISKLALFYMYKGSYDSSSYYYSRLRDLGISNKNELVVARSDLGFGNIAEYRSDYETALAMNLKALSYFESKKDTMGIAAASGNAGNAYIRLAQYQKAVELLGRAVNLYSKKQLKRSVANNLSSLARAYKGLGDKQKELELKLKAFSLFKEEAYKKGMATVAMNLGAFYTDNDQPAEALNYFTIALQNSWEINDKGNIGTLYAQLADLYQRTNQRKQAMLSVDSALFYAQKSGDRLTQADALLVKAALMNAAGEYTAARQVSRRATEVRDSIYNNRMQAKVADMEVKYETAKKENQIRNGELLLQQNQLELTEQKQNLLISRLELKNKDQELLNQRLDAEKKEQDIRSLQKQSKIQSLELTNQALMLRQRNFAIGIILLLIGGSAMLLYSWYRRNKLRQENEMQQQLLNQHEQMSRAVIEAEEKERKRIASDLHDGVGQLFSAVRMNLNGLFDRVRPERDEDKFLVEKTMALVDESCKEVRVISHQMMPNMLLRSGIASDVKSFIEKLDSENLKVNLEAHGFKNSLESNVETVLYRVIQESVNNVIKHARATALDIRLNRDATGIHAAITDNGIGFNTAIAEDFNGIGLKNIAARIEYLKGTVAYDSAPGKGTRVVVWVPVG